MKTMKSKKELLLSAGLILTATLGLTGCSTTESVTPAPETNTGEKVEVEAQKPSTDEDITDSTATPEPEVEVQKPTPEVEINSSTTENAQKKHPFGEVKVLQESYRDYFITIDDYTTRYLNIGLVEFNSTDVTKEDLVNFYKQEVKGSDYRRVFIVLKEDLAIMFDGTKGLFAVGKPYISTSTDGLSDLSEIYRRSVGFITKDGDVVYSEKDFYELFEDATDKENRIATISKMISDYQFSDVWLDDGLHLYVDPSFIPVGTEEEQMKVIKEAITDLVAKVKEEPSHTTLPYLSIYFGGTRDNHNPIASLHIDFETLMTTDWDAFARGEFFLDGDEFYMSEPY